MFWVWLSVAGAIGLAAILWATAYNLGFDRGKGTVLRELNLSTNGAITEPLRNDPIPVNPNLLTAPAKSTPQAGAGSGAATKAAPAAGAAGSDPRLAGLNYLVISAKTDRESASRMVAYLTENGIPAFAVALAVKSGAANNPPSYRVYAQKGITREELSARAQVRTELEGKVAKLGKAWLREHKGGTDFSQTYWEKFGS